MHNVFHVLLLRDWHDNGVHTGVSPIEIDGEAEYEVSGIKGHRDRGVHGSVGQLTETEI